jgi:hypothetical protein
MLLVLGGCDWQGGSGRTSHGEGDGRIRNDRCDEVVLWLRKLEVEVEVAVNFGFDVGKSECGIVAFGLGSARSG